MGWKKCSERQYASLFENYPTKIKPNCNMVTLSCRRDNARSVHNNVFACCGLIYAFRLEYMNSFYESSTLHHHSLWLKVGQLNTIRRATTVRRGDVSYNTIWSQYVRAVIAVRCNWSNFRTLMVSSYTVRRLQALQYCEVLEANS